MTEKKVLLINNLFALAILDKFLLYAPLHQLSALVDRQALREIQQWQKNESETCPRKAVFSFLQQSVTYPTDIPSIRVGPVKKPLFLGLIPTRGCNMACRYCDFAAPKNSSPVMSLSLARAAVMAYFHLLGETGETQAAIHFFGGEPFWADEVIHFVVPFAAATAASHGITVHFEATSNGLYNENRCRWIADHFHTLVLSLDGPADVQNYQRPALNGRQVDEIITRNARILSQGNVNLIVRVCVTAATVTRLPEIAHWLSQEFQPSAVCWETLIASPLALAAGLVPPDPWQFALQFNAAATILESQGIQTILSTADISANRLTFCPVGQDALIVTPEGQINACYLLERDWQRQDLDLRLGYLDEQQNRFVLDPQAVRHARQLNVTQKPFCTNCLCRFHCAGGCHVNHTPGGPHDPLCIQTRLITIASLLRQLNQPELAVAWLSAQAADHATTWQMSDYLVDQQGL